MQPAPELGTEQICWSGWSVCLPK